MSSRAAAGSGREFSFMVLAICSCRSRLEAFSAIARTPALKVAAGVVVTQFAVN